MNERERAVFGVGLALLRQQGVPEHVAQRAMREDPECLRIAEQVVPVLAQLVQRLNALLQNDPSPVSS